MILRDKIIVITGGSQGFGKALASLFVAEGSHVIIASNTEYSLKTTANELSVDSFLTDVTSPEAMRKLGEYVYKKYGTIDIWINNAGIQIAPSPVEDVDIQKLHHLFEVNYFGYFYGCQIALLHFKKQGKGAIINVNSTAGLEGKPELSAYVSSKFAIKGLTETIRKEVSNTNIKIYDVYPGGMQTEIYKEKYPSDLKQYMDVGFVAKKVIENLKADNPEVSLIIKRPK